MLQFLRWLQHLQRRFSIAVQISPEMPTWGRQQGVNDGDEYDKWAELEHSLKTPAGLSHTKRFC